MTKAEVIEALGQKMQANRDEVRRQLEFLASLPGHVVTNDGKDLLVQLSLTWKEGQALREVANELVGIVYADPAPAPSNGQEHGLS